MPTKNTYNTLFSWLNKPVHVAPLATFRVFFGLMMLISIIRFWWYGWIEQLYIQPKFHFTYYGFSWIKPLGEWTYLLFAICGICAFLIMIGYKYKVAIVLFFLSFTYIELMDKTTYLNHYYFISLISFILIFLPANAYFSVDSKDLKNRFTHIPNWTTLSIKVLLSIVYFYAGLAKLNSDWLLEAMPLKIWLPANTSLPLIGSLLKETWFIYGMAWCGMLYDLSIPFLLFYKRTRILAFIAVVVFHVFTRILFPIGMFPIIMIFSTIIFFSPAIHLKIIAILRRLFFIENQSLKAQEIDKSYTFPLNKGNLILGIFSCFIAFQLLLPFRYLLYPGELFWHEQGYRFSWRVMLTDKVGYTTFIIKDENSNKVIHVEASEYLTPFQEKQMAFQPDFILEFAHYLGEEYKNKGFEKPSVYAESFVAFNGRRSRRLIKPDVDLLKIEDSNSPKTYIIPFNENIYGL